MSLTALFDVAAPAKLNLFLHIVGRRADGYHLLQSVFVLIDWCDTLHFERRGDGRLARHDLGPALPADDLCLRAARALQAASGTTLGADIAIDKQLPWGAGLGGGSSDAASTLLALNRLWGLDWPRARLAEIGLALGADVPFFIGGHNAFVEGIGERLTPLDLPAMGLAVVKPAASIETRALFQHPALVRDTEAVILAGSLAGVDAFSRQVASASPVYGRNDMLPAAEALCPEVKDVSQWLQARFGNSRMTGSGSAVFARVAPRQGEKTDSGTVAALSATPLAELPPGWVGRWCHSLALHPLAGWARD